jgi:hypothetical protein
MKSTVFAGIIEFSGQSDASYNSGLYRRTPQRESWERLDNGLPDGSQVHAIVGRPGDPQALYIGTQFGLFYSTDSGDSWTDLGVPVTDSAVYSILLHPNDPETIYAGMDHTVIYKTEDGGDTWRRLPTVQPEAALTGCFPVRVLRMALDPSAPEEIYGALEVGGFIRSLDDSYLRIPNPGKIYPVHRFWLSAVSKRCGYGLACDGRMVSRQGLCGGFPIGPIKLLYLRDLTDDE